MKYFAIILLCLILVVTFSGCFPRTDNVEKSSPAGFFKGIWHGWIAPISLIVSLFDHTVRIYEPYNTGWWYDFGFYIAVIAGFGGVALSRKQKDERPHT